MQQADEIQIRMQMHDVERQLAQTIGNYYHSDGSDGYWDTESDLSELTISSVSVTDDDTESEPEFEDSGSGETMASDVYSGVVVDMESSFDESSFDDIDDESELSSLDVTVFSSTSLSDFSDF